MFIRSVDDMQLFLYFVFIFFIGSTLGYVLELFYRRIAGGKWVNPGFLIGPYLPIYGFGLCILTLIYLLFYKLNVWSVFIILLMGASMTFIELIGGLCFLKTGGVKLWDYSERKWNYKGIICPLFSLIWTLISAIYYYFIGSKVLNALNWFSNNQSFSFILGVFFGVIVIDFVCSTNALMKIRKFTKENNFVIKYEEFKKHIADFQTKQKKKYSFLFPYKQGENLLEYLTLYKKSKEGSTNKRFSIFKKKEK